MKQIKRLVFSDFGFTLVLYALLFAEDYFFMRLPFWQYMAMCVIVGLAYVGGVFFGGLEQVRKVSGYHNCFLTYLRENYDITKKNNG